MIDEARIRDMRETFGDAEFTEFIGLFEEEAAGIVADLSLRSGDALGASLHALRGSAENMGLRELSLQCRRGESRIGTGEDVDTAVIADAFHDSLRSLRAHVGLD